MRYNTGWETSLYVCNYTDVMHRFVTSTDFSLLFLLKNFVKYAVSDADVFYFLIQTCRGQHHPVRSPTTSIRVNVQHVKYVLNFLF